MFIFSDPGTRLKTIRNIPSISPPAIPGSSIARYQNETTHLLMQSTSCWVFDSYRSRFMHHKNNFSFQRFHHVSIIQSMARFFTNRTNHTINPCFSNLFTLWLKKTGCRLFPIQFPPRSNHWSFQPPRLCGNANLLPSLFGHVQRSFLALYTHGTWTRTGPSIDRRFVRCWKTKGVTLWKKHVPLRFGGFPFFFFFFGFFRNNGDLIHFGWLYKDI